MPPRSLVLASPAIVIAAVLIVPMLLHRAALNESSFDPEPLDALEDQDAKMVIIGNSMVFTRLDRDYLREISGEDDISLLAEPGAFSACWFLWMKNYVCAMKTPPRTAIIFFRDDQLTLPNYKVEGAYQRYILTLMKKDEPEVEALTKISTPKFDVESPVLDQWFYPLLLSRWKVQRQVYNLSMDVAAAGSSKRTLKREAEEFFKVKNLRKDIQGDMAGEEAEEASVFNVEESFLPGIIKLAKKENIRLIFYRVKRRPHTETVRNQPSYTVEYMKHLRKYLDEQGIELVDETDDPRLTLKMYADGDHVAEEYMKTYTDMWWERMKPVLSRKGS